ncbi:hypothetical protein ATY79_14145 [Rhizobium sp. R693]|nr:hypothetical protein ATY79_14145 [Rhizobium sp. R693]
MIKVEGRRTRASVVQGGGGGNAGTGVRNGIGEAVGGQALLSPLVGTAADGPQTPSLVVRRTAVFVGSGKVPRGEHFVRQLSHDAVFRET